MKLSLKKRKPIVYISLGFYVTLISLIIIESCIPGGASGAQSNFFATISAWFINLIEGPKTPKSIAPESFNEVTDSSYLGKDENGISNIAIGTTTLVTIPIQYPEKEDSYDVYNKKYEISYVLGNKDHYNLVMSSSDTLNNTYTIHMRIVANEMGDALYQININVAETLKYEYKFHIVELAEPKEYEARLQKTNLKINETAQIETKLTGKNRDDYYLRRLFDISKIARSSSNPSIATVDEYGVIHAVAQGEATITYGKETFNIIVSDESISLGESTLNLTVSESSKKSPSLLDYDYIFTGDNNPDDYSVLVYPEFSNNELLDKSVSWSISNDLCAKLAPHHYDTDGYPIYYDNDNRACVRVSGYRKNTNFTLTCISNALNISKTMELELKETKAESFTVNHAEELYTNEQKVISAKFYPENTFNTKIHVSVSDESYISVTNNDSSSVTITGLKRGETKIKVSSISNPDLVFEYTVKVNEKDPINDDNYKEFALSTRKFLGHFFLFFVTAIFGFIFFYNLLDDDKKIWVTLLFSAGVGLLVASLSEVIQLLVPGRSGEIIDVLIDFVGYLAATIVMFLIIFIIKLIKKKRAKSPQKEDEI